MEFVTINENNFREFWNLSVSSNQIGQVADNIKILARAFVYRDYNPVVYGISQKNEPIGLLLYRNYHKNEDSIKYLEQFMIDKNYQNNGYGTLAIKKLITILKNDNIKKLYLHYKDGHNDVLKFYEKLGFQKTGNTDEDEIELVLQIN